MEYVIAGYALSSVEGRVAMEFFDMSETGQAKKWVYAPPVSEFVGFVEPNQSSPSWRMDRGDEAISLAKADTMLVASCADTPLSAIGNLRRVEIPFIQLMQLHFTQCESL